MKKAVIVAAGLSSRLYPLTLEKPKGLLTINDEEFLNRSIRLLKANGIEEIALVVGYRKNLIIETLGDSYTYIINPFYKNGNNMSSLWFAKDFVQGEPFIYLHGDILYHEDILSETLKQFSDNKNDIELVTDFCETDEEAMKVLVTEEKYLIESNKEIDLKKSAGEWTGIAYINKSKELFTYIENILLNESLNYYDTYAFTKMAQNEFKVHCSSTNNLPWIEVDFLDDYEKAVNLFS